MTTYVTDDEGKFIPASQRPDGTWRKARRVKQGYVPQEEVPLYESKGKQFANRKSTVPPGFCPFAGDAKKERIKANEATKKPAAKQPGLLVLPGAAKKAKAKTSSAKPPADKKTDAPPTELLASLSIAESAEDVGKKLKKLRKKLREIETIEEKMKSGDLKKPEKEQLDKVKRKKEILKEMKLLEAEESQLLAATAAADSSAQ